MAIITIGYFQYETDDKRKQCPECGGDMYDDPHEANRLGLSDGQFIGMIAGEWGVCTCPRCGRVDYWEF